MLGECSTARSFGLCRLSSSPPLSACVSAGVRMLWGQDAVIFGWHGGAA